MPKFGQVLGTECGDLSAWRGLIYFWRRGGSENSNSVTSNVYANAPDQRRILHAGHPYHPISNELKQTNKPRKHGRLMWLRKTTSEALLLCPLYSPL